MNFSKLQIDVITSPPKVELCQRIRKSKFKSNLLRGKSKAKEDLIYMLEIKFSQHSINTLMCEACMRFNLKGRKISMKGSPWSCVQGKQLHGAHLLLVGAHLLLVGAHLLLVGA